MNQEKLLVLIWYCNFYCQKAENKNGKKKKKENDVKNLSLLEVCSLFFESKINFVIFLFLWERERERERDANYAGVFSEFSLLYPATAKQQKFMLLFICFVFVLFPFPVMFFYVNIFSTGMNFSCFDSFAFSSFLCLSLFYSFVKEREREREREREKMRNNCCWRRDFDAMDNQRKNTHFLRLSLSLSLSLSLIANVVAFL